MQVFAGIEGGASFSKGVLVSENGAVLSTIEDAPSTNYLLVGSDVCNARIAEIIETLEKKASIDSAVVVVGIGLCLSGCEDETANDEFARNLLQKYPNLAKRVVVGSDTLAAIMSANPKGGIVLISGTGSNSLLLNPDGKTKKCGGWGHMLGDNGSGYWIVNKTIVAILNAEDNFNPLPYDIQGAKKLILEHFGMKEMIEILKPAYINFSKTQFAAMCAKLAALANSGDGLCAHIFKEAGKELGLHVVALFPFADKRLLEAEGGLTVVCCGSVFKSWNLLKDGFLSALGSSVKELTLLQLTRSAALGAAFFAAKTCGFQLPIDFDNTSVLYHHKL
ncbi:N-acetyl-D-glucosamine kinase-like protein [Leptotrombidium deliense]|uniref:N-acetyl-D-glucosamine kinase n=1 Tax=Leptotrombidium deliense TaxID=299467 RepID=A0A443SHV6_9ACAR|nr:N-acetyl-D-glucosamine kinase-like protein [Leptotrombidium deliense]